MPVANYRWKAQSGLTTYDFAAAAIATYEGSRNTDPGIANVLAPTAYKIHAVDLVGTASAGGEVPAAPTWGLAPTPGNGQVTLHVVAASPTDVIYARHSRFLATPSWSAESETFKRTGTGDIVITGLTNEQYSMFTVYTKAAGLTSAWLAPRYAAPTAGLAAQIDQIMAAVAAEINVMGLTSKNTSGGSVAIAAEVEIPAQFDAVDTPCVKVFPDTEEGEAARGDRNQITYRVDIAFCQRSKTTPQQTEQFRVRQSLRDHFLGRRLDALPKVICTEEAESGVLDMEALAERFQWISVITLEFSASRTKG